MAPPPLKGRIVPVAALSAAQRDAMWTLFGTYYAAVRRETFEGDLSRKHHVILLEDAATRALAGFSTLVVFNHTLQGQNFRAVFSGDTVVDRAYWGQKTLQVHFTRYVLQQKLRHPLVPLYWFLITKGWRTYLLLSRYFPEYWPRHDVPTVAFPRAVLQHLGHTMYGTHWDGEAGVIRAPPDGGHLKEDVAPLTPELLQAADIAFFARVNPGHVHGDELACLGRVDLAFAGAFVRKLVTGVGPNDARNKG